MSIKRTGLGFTLIELLVAITASGIILTAVMTSYAALLRNKQRIDHFRHTQSAATLILSRITDKVRDYGIDYASYAGGDASDSSNELHIGGFDDGSGTLQTGHFRFTDTGAEYTQNSVTSPLNAKNVVVTGEFTVLPGSVPDTGIWLIQPKVHVALTVASALDPDVQIQLQTTVSSRQYR